MKHAVKVTDGLLKGVWWMTNQLKQEAEKGHDNLLCLNIRKALGAAHEFVERLCSNSAYMANSGVWMGIVTLESVKQLNILLPNEFSNLRNLFQYMVAETFLCLYQARIKALGDKMCEA